MKVRKASSNKTLAELFKGVTIITQRPEGMSYEDYVRYRREQTKAIRNALK